MDLEKEALNYSKHGSLSEWFQRQAKLTPNAIALSDINKSYSFRELDDLTTLLAKYLIDKFNVKKNSSIITIYMKISNEHVIANIAILKSGGAFMDLDESTATGGVQEMYNEIKPVCLLVTGETFVKIKDKRIPNLVLDENWPSRIHNPKFDIRVELPKCGVDDIAYIAYTSGTTGKPKGIVCPLHAPMYSYHYLHELLPFEENEVYGCNVYITWEVMRPLLKGVQAFILDPDIISNKGLLQRCVKRNSITRMMVTPSILEQILMYSELNTDDYSSVRYFMLCGEVVTVKLAKRLMVTFPWIKLYNLYSIAETHDVAICDLNAFVENGGGSESAYCPVGKPSPGVIFHILDDDKQPVPIGKPGQIYIESPTLAKGYINNPDKTKMAFIANSNGQRIYKTGDVGRMSSDHNLEIWGRCDSLIKIKGRSVNIKGVESILLQHPRVNACVVSIVGTLSNRKLITYIVPNGEVTAKELENQVTSQSMSILVPDEFVFLKSVPVNVKTSKFDLKTLQNEFNE